MKNIRNYFTEDQLVELEKIVVLLASREVNTAMYLLKGLEIYEKFLNYLVDNWKTFNSREAVAIANLFGYNLWYGFVINCEGISHPIMECLPERNLIGGNLLISQDLLNTQSNININHLGICFLFEGERIFQTVYFYDFVEQYCPLEKVCRYTHLKIKNMKCGRDLIDSIPKNIRCLDLIVHYDSDQLIDDYKWEEFKNGDMEYFILGELDLSCLTALESLSIRYVGGLTVGVYPNTLKYLRCEMMDGTFINDYRKFLKVEMPKLSKIKGLSIELVGGTLSFLAINTLLRSHGFVYDSNKNVFVTQIP